MLTEFGRRLRAVRRRLAKWLEPPLEDDPAWDVPIDISLKGAAALRQELGVDEESYLRVAGQAWADPRSYVLYTALDEVEKAAMYLMRIREFLSGPLVSPHADRLSRVMVTHLLEEQRARVRRLLEVLVLLILFESSDEQEHYRHLLLLEGLNDLLSSNLDLEEFYGARSANIDDSIQHQAHWIRQVEEDLDLAKAWYARGAGGLPKDSQLFPGRVLSSMRSRVRAAIPLMSDSERLLFGFSYAGMYGLTSEAVHYSPKREDYRLREGEEYAVAGGIGMLNLHILNRCHALMGRPSDPVVDKLQESLEQNEASKLAEAATRRAAQVGDFVLVYGDLAQVVEIKESDYAYRSYRVTYLAEKPKPEIQEDWFPARVVQVFHTKQRFFDGLQELVDAGRLPADIAERMGALDDEEIHAILRASMVNVWELGLRDWVKSQQEVQAEGGDPTAAP